jgi:hypothetical protein
MFYGRRGALANVVHWPSGATNQRVFLQQTEGGVKRI